MNWREINEVTWKLYEDGGGVSRTDHRHGMWQGWNSPKALAWVIRVGSGWYARFENKAVGPLPLGAAKRAAEALAQGGFEGRAVILNNPIEWLNRVAAA